MGSCLDRTSNKITTEVEIISHRTEFPITKKEIALLQDSWCHLRSKWNAVCGSAFEKWLIIHPEIIDVFHNLSTELETYTMKDAPTLLKHVRSFEKLFDSVLFNLNNRRDIISTVIIVGKLHHTSFGVTQLYVTSLAKSIALGICTHVKLEIECQNAWTSLITFLADLLKIGMRLAIAEEKVDTN